MKNERCNKRMKVLNLYAGIGGNRKLWKNCNVTAVENNVEVATIYKKQFPKDKIIIGDAHQYLKDHYKDFDFIWSSPPCPTHSRLCYCKSGDKEYPDMKLWQEIIFLKTWFKGKWVIENVIPYYEPLDFGIKPQNISRHYFWSNFEIKKKKFEKIDISRCSPGQLIEFLQMPKCKRQYLRNCVYPKVGLHVLNCAIKQGGKIK